MVFRNPSLEGVVMNPEFWRNKTVLVTGNTGFKGGWLTLWLERSGARVVGFSLESSANPELFQKAEGKGQLTMVYGDVRDSDLVRRTLEIYRPEVVIHMAAQALVRPSYEDPVLTYETNVMGTVSLLEAMRRVPGVRAAVMVTSDKCYENLETSRPYAENDPMGGHDPYSSSKGCAELVVAAYRRSFFSSPDPARPIPAVASVRAGNVIGGGDWSRDRLVPDAMKSFMAGEKLVIRNPGAVRPWQHVLDPLTGYLMLAEKLYTRGRTYAGAWNFGPARDDSRPVAWIVRQLGRFWNEPVDWEHTGESGPHEAGMLLLDSAKAEKKLGWKPRLKIMPALAWTVAWYKACQRGADIRALTMRQISNYEQLNHSDRIHNHLLQEATTA